MILWNAEMSSSDRKAFSKFKTLDGMEKIWNERQESKRKEKKEAEGGTNEATGNKVARSVNSL